MTVEELRSLLDGLSDNMEVVFKVVDEVDILEDIGVERPFDNTSENKDNDLNFVIQVSHP